MLKLHVEGTYLACSYPSHKSKHEKTNDTQTRTFILAVQSGSVEHFNTFSVLNLTRKNENSEVCGGCGTEQEYKLVCTWT